MARANEAEQKALNEAGLLVRFAAENVSAKDLDPALLLAVARAQAAHANDAWTPEIAQAFWDAFSKLCTLIQPATMACIAAANPVYPRKSWVFFGREVGRQSLAERTSVRCLPFMIVVLALVLSLQFYVWAITGLAKGIDDTIASARASEAKLEVAYNKSLAGQLSRPAQQALAAEAVKQVQDIGVKGMGVINDVHLLAKLTFWTFDAHMENKPKLPTDPMDIALNYDYGQQIFPWLVPTVYPVQHNAALVVGIVGSFILPVLLGALGACAFVLRNISEQIRMTTFSQTSPIRHLIRVVLGVLLGGIIGLFTNLTTQLTLPLLAIAFLAGYGVEGVFSMFDGFIERFRAAAK
jgi:hypothetical protein